STSPCIDTGDPGSPVAFEPYPNGGIINMGAYGGTDKAGKSPSGLHAKYGGGTGEPDNPYLIYTDEHMNTIGLHEEDFGRHFKQMADIDLGSLGERDFNIIGRYPSSFKGVFNGSGHTISNFRYISTDVNDVAIFNSVEGEQALITDLGLIDPVIDVESNELDFVVDWNDPNAGAVYGNTAGSLVNYLSRGALLSFCYVRGGSVSGDLWVGGLVSYVDQGIIDRCYSTAEVSGKREIGGLTGYNSRGTITNCHTISNITGENFAGGLVGHNEGTIENCYAMGDVTCDSTAGGLAGYNIETIESSYSTGNVTGVHEIGGLVGRSRGNLTNCYSTGSVSGEWSVGGLVGFFGGPITITNCYSVGNVTGIENVGGLVGTGHSLDDVLGSFWDIEGSGQTTSFRGTGKTTAEMQTAGTFLDAGWDFFDETENGDDDIWWITEGQDYPRLWWELSD
ncbi:MAG: GLUG motif-containing protein, partial [Sedimentisphaerales bacterium]